MNRFHMFIRKQKRKDKISRNLPNYFGILDHNDTLFSFFCLLQLFVLVGLLNMIGRTGTARSVLLAMLLSLFLRSLRGSLFGLLSRQGEFIGFLGGGRRPFGLQTTGLVFRLETRDLKGYHEENATINKEKGYADGLVVV